MSANGLNWDNMELELSRAEGYITEKIYHQPNPRKEPSVIHLMVAKGEAPRYSRLEGMITWLKGATFPDHNIFDYISGLYEHEGGLVILIKELPPEKVLFLLSLAWEQYEEDVRLAVYHISDLVRPVFQSQMGCETTQQHHLAQLVALDVHAARAAMEPDHSGS